jgi:hypothetical protein
MDIKIPVLLERLPITNCALEKQLQWISLQDCPRSDILTRGLDKCIEGKASMVGSRF